MNREGAIGTATVLALAAVVGVSWQTGSKPAEDGARDGIAQSRRAKAIAPKVKSGERKPGCSSVEETLEAFVGVDELEIPDECYEEKPAQDKPRADLTQKTKQLGFVIALMPDPVHTHSSALFDQFSAAIQEGAQDEEYEFDSSWLPWDSDDTSYVLLADEKLANREKDMKEEQPGVVLFRRKATCGPRKKCKTTLLDPYGQGLVVFVVGEDATHGVHREQLSNALRWMAKLQPRPEISPRRVAILGPTFSGSFPSLAQVLNDPETALNLDLNKRRKDDVHNVDTRLAVYSGSVTSSVSAKIFQDAFIDRLVFHSFVQDDGEVLARFCAYITTEQSRFELKRVAIISEDETAYGESLIENTEKNKKPTPDRTDCEREALKLYYPRDISALRDAYQSKSLFDRSSPSSSTEEQKRNLPTDLADPTGKVHDSIRSFGGNQTPLAQEAFLMQIVAALRELRARYIVLRSSSPLDLLFLANFLRRSYPDGRIVILGSDLMFIRERGSTGLSGAMTLSTYPLFPLERDWTEHQSMAAADRTFSADTAEGTYVAFRLLLNHKSLPDGTQDATGCRVLDPLPGSPPRAAELFVPAISCETDPPIPDYSPPFWTLIDQCGEKVAGSSTGNNTGPDCPYPGPATWLSVIGVNRFWPMAALTSVAPRSELKQDPIVRLEKRDDDPVGLPKMPLGMKVFFLGLTGFAVFHAWCCSAGSYTAKPIFRAHFASTGEPDQKYLVFFGSCCLAFMGIVAGWGCGVFAIPLSGLHYSWTALVFVIIVWLLAWIAILSHSRKSFELSQDKADVPTSDPSFPTRRTMTRDEYRNWDDRASGLLIAATVIFCLIFILPLNRSILVENGTLALWRAMHLTSGVSPLVPVFAILAGLYLSFWFTLHGLALFGPDRPCLPCLEMLTLKDEGGKTLKDKNENDRDLLRMFSQEDAAVKIETAAEPPNRSTFAIAGGIFLAFVVIGVCIGGRVPVRSLGSQNYAILFLMGLNICCTLSLLEAFRLYHLWSELNRLLAFIDRVPLRRTLASLRGFSWGSVWKMSGNVLEVRYRVISRQMECMNHTLASLDIFQKDKKDSPDPRVANCHDALTKMREAGGDFGDWYSKNYCKHNVGDLRNFTYFQKKIADASGTLFAQLLIPAWRLEEDSLLVGPLKDDKKDDKPDDKKDEIASNQPVLSNRKHIRNAEEFVCLNYLSYVQNVLGRLRTMAMTIIALFVAAACAMSSYPFDPRQALSAVLIALFVVGAVVIVKVYADMHRDATLSHVTNTKPGELGTEFWLKIAGFGFAPLLGLLTRIFPGATDFLFSWLQPGIASLK